jgi:hypothetical protein
MQLLEVTQTKELVARIRLLMFNGVMEFLNWPRFLAYPLITVISG